MRETGPIRWHLGTTPEEIDAAKPYLSIARTQLGITKNLMKLGGLSQHARAVTLPDGTVITTHSVLGQDTVGITLNVPSVASPPVEEGQEQTIPIQDHALVFLQDGTELLIWDSAKKTYTVVFNGDNVAARAIAPGGGSLLGMNYTATDTILLRQSGQWFENDIGPNADTSGMTNDATMVVGNDTVFYDNPSSPTYLLYVTETQDVIAYSTADDEAAGHSLAPYVLGNTDPYFFNRGVTALDFTYDLDHTAFGLQGQTPIELLTPSLTVPIGTEISLVFLKSQDSIATTWTSEGRNTFGIGSLDGVSGDGRKIIFNYFPFFNDPPQVPKLLIDGVLTHVGPAYGRLIAISNNGEYAVGNGGDDPATETTFILSLSDGAITYFSADVSLNAISNRGVAVGSTGTAAILARPDGATAEIQGIRFGRNISADGRVVIGYTSDGISFAYIDGRPNELSGTASCTSSMIPVGA